MKYQFRTWHAESAVVALILLLTVLFTGGKAVELLGAVAVWLGFSHASISERMREQEAIRTVPSVECYNKLGWYFMGREVCWTLYFLWLGAWSAIVGCILFAAYPVWRRYWRSIHPLPSPVLTIPVRDPAVWDAIRSGEIRGLILVVLRGLAPDRVRRYVLHRR